jgi:hypothetical protein
MEVKELLYTRLAGDATLKTLLGGTTADSHIYPVQRGAAASLPAVSMRVTDGPSDVGHPISRPTVDLTIEGKVSEAEVVAISARIEALVNRASVQGSGLVIHLARRVFVRDDFDPEAQQFIRDERYALIVQ